MTDRLHVAVVGASGRVGRRLVEYALEAGYEVTAVARRAGAIPAPLRERARVVEADVLRPETLPGALRGADVVLSALAAPSVEAPGDTLSRGMRNIVAAARSPGAPRVLCIANAGVLDDPRGGLRFEAPDFPDLYRGIVREHAGAWAALRESALSWTLVCPTDMPSGARTGRYRAAVDRLPEGGAEISAEDVADFMVREAREGRYRNVRVGLAY